MIAISDSVKVRKDLPSGTIILSRQETRNALSRDVVARLQEALEDFQGEKRVKAVILTGSGNSFCSGSDLKELHETLKSPQAEQQWQQDVEQLLMLIETMLRFPKPIICAANGSVCGSGAALLLAADTVVASEQSFLSFPDSRVGLVSGVAIPLLAFRVGAGRAANLVLTGAQLDAPKCRDDGIFHEIVSEELVWARAQEIAQQIDANCHQSMLISKRLINETLGEELLTQLRIGAAQTAAARTSELAHEGIAAFIEKRDPDFD